MNQREFSLMTYTGAVMIAIGFAAIFAGAMLSGSVAVGTGSLLVFLAMISSWWSNGQE